MVFGYHSRRRSNGARIPSVFKWFQDTISRLDPNGARIRVRYVRCLDTVRDNAEIVLGYHLGSNGSQIPFQGSIQMVPEYELGTYGVWIPFEMMLKSRQHHG